MKILIADDDIIFAKIVKTHLTNWGYSPMTVENGDAALEALADPYGPNIVLLDWEMPRRTGLEVLQELPSRADLKAIHPIMVTSRNSKEDLLKALQAGAADFISKPVNFEELRLRLKVAELRIEGQKRLLQKRSEDFHRDHLDSLRGMIQGAAHHISGPLDIIKEAAQTIDENVNDLKFQNCTTSIRTHATKISEVIGSLKKFSSIDLTPLDDSTSLRKILEDILNVYQMYNDYQAVDVTLSIAEDISLPMNREHLLDALEQIIRNAFEHVIHFEEKWIEITATPRDGEISISIRNSGSTIAPDIRPKVFDPFFSGKSSVGLGLSICSGLISSLGGAISLEEESQNTCFTVLLPTFQEAS